MTSMVERQQSPSPTIARDDTHGEPDSSKKRRLSHDLSEQEDSKRSPKRARADCSSPHDVPAAKAPPSPPSTTTSITTQRDKAKPTSRSDSVQEEKKRGRRLFGGLLSTLSQSTPSTHQKRRQDIERRQQERAHQRQSEDEKLKGKRLAKLRKVRQVEQVSFDEQVMKTRHGDILAKARFLRTRCEPSVYYLPWRPTEMQTEQIDRQLRDAKDLVHREEEEFGRRKRQRLKDLGVAVKEAHESSNTTNKTGQSESEGQFEEKADGSSRREDVVVAQDSHIDGGASPTKPEEQNGDADARTDHEPTPSVAVAEEEEEEHEDNGDADVMVEDDEDAVIY